MPADLYDRVERKSQLVDAPFSTTLAEIVRRALDREDQARLEEALRLDRDANAAFSRIVSPVTSRVISQGDSESTG